MSFAELYNFSLPPVALEVYSRDVGDVKAHPWVLDLAARPNANTSLTEVV